MENLKNLFVSSEKAILEGDEILEIKKITNEIALSLFQELKNQHSEFISDLSTQVISGKKLKSLL